MGLFVAGNSTPSVLGSSTLSLLDAGRSNAPGIGLSASARALTSNFLSQTKGGLATILSAGKEDQVRAAQLQIGALRVGKSGSEIARSLRPIEPEISPSTRGTEVDTEA